MKKDLKRKKSAPPREPEGSLTALVNTIQQQLIALEQKIDILVNRPAENTFKQKHFSKPFDRFHRHDNKKQNDGTRQNNRNFTDVVCADCNKTCSVPFKPSGDRPVYCKDCFSKHKGGNSFKERYNNTSRDNNTPFGRYFNKRRNNEDRSLEKKKRPMFRKRKNHL